MQTPLELEAQQARQAQAVQAQQAQAYQRPQMPMPAPGQSTGFSAADAGAFWSNFTRIMETNPEQGHLMLQHARPEALRSKILIAEG
jgi:hypothetical protein